MESWSRINVVVLLSSMCLFGCSFNDDSRESDSGRVEVDQAGSSATSKLQAGQPSLDLSLDPINMGVEEAEQLEAALSRMLEQVDIELNTQATRGRILLDEDGSYTIKDGDSLSALIEDVGLSTNLKGEVLQRAFVVANPRAFRRANPNWMYAGAKLRMPTVEDLKGMLFKAGQPTSDKSIRQEDAVDWIRYPR